MNHRQVLKQLCHLVLALSGILALIAVGSFLGPRDAPVERSAEWALVLAAVIGIAFGGGGWAATRGAPARLGRREALVLVALSWIVGAALAAAPFFLWAHLGGPERAAHPFRGFVDCYFEAMSGLTTTGATILDDVEAIPKSLLLWRSLTQWLGGLGIVVLFVAVLPSLGVGGKRLFRVESAGADQEGLRPLVRDTARMLLLIYLCLSAIGILALTLVGGMSLFDGACHLFGSIATGGFSTRNEGIGAFESHAVHVIIIVFMILGAVNFGLYHQLARRRFSNVLHDVELRVFLLMLLVASTVVIGVLWASPEPILSTTRTEVPSDLGVSAEAGLFTTSALSTTTGFCANDFDRWPFLAQAVLVVVMFVGGSTGSTAGGIKVLRIWVALKVIIAELERAYRPNVIRPVRVAGSAIDIDLKLGTLTYVVGFVMLFVVGSIALMLIEQVHPGSPCDFTTAAGASLATLSNVGPGLGGVGALENYAWFSGASKVVLCLLMALGRLEVFAIVLLLAPRFWRGR